jgi:enoyl-CoA hydratase/carnithine racemase
MTLGVEHLRFERRGSVAWCTIDRPAARNALTSAMYIGLGEALERTTRDPDLEALVITALGDVFIPGGDVKDNSAGAKMVPSQTVPFAAFRDAVVPVVTAINGLCQASGLLFAMLSDIAIASVRATFRAPELFVGVPDTWLAALLPAHVGMSRARELVMTGRKIDATEAHAIGLVSKVVDHDRLQEAAQEIVLEILETAPEARKQWRRAANALYGAVDEETLDRATAGPEAVEGMAAFLEHRPPAWSRRASL